MRIDGLMMLAATAANNKEPKERHPLRSVGIQRAVSGM
jgi:hypothetical protein